MRGLIGSKYPKPPKLSYGVRYEGAFATYTLNPKRILREWMMDLYLLDKIFGWIGC